MFRSLSVSVLLLSSLAVASPKVGDFAAFDATLTQGGQAMPLEITLELTQHDAAQNRYMQKQVIKVGGQDQVSEDWVAAADLLTDEIIDGIVSGCEREGGKIESVEAARSTIQTCAIAQDTAEEKGTVWIGKVPFGLVKLDTTYKSNNSHLVALLKEYK